MLALQLGGAYIHMSSYVSSQVEGTEVSSFAAHYSLSRPSKAESFRAQQTLALWCPEYMRMASPVDRSHRRALQSEEAVTRYAASTENTQSQTHL